MKLTKIQVHNFRNILDSGPIDIGGDVTCLVGKNESGKTGILQALNRVKPALPSTFDEGDEYPRWLHKRDKATGVIESVRPIVATFVLDDDDVATLEAAFGAGILGNRTITVSRSYANAMEIAVDTDEAAAVADLVKNISGHLVTPGLQAIKGLKALRGELDAAAVRAGAEAADEEYLEQVADAKALVESRFEKFSVMSVVLKAVARLVPEFFYFDEYSQLPGTIQIAPLLEALRNGATADLNSRQRTALTLLAMAPPAMTR